MVRRPLIQSDLQKLPQTQRIRYSPCNATLALDPFEKPDQHHPEVDPWRQRRTPQRLVIELPARLRRTRQSRPDPALRSNADRKDGPELPPDPRGTKALLAADVAYAFPPFYPHSSHFGEWVKAEASTLQYDPSRRERVSTILERQNRSWDASPQTFANLDRLRRGAAAIVTGQQVGLFGGPMFAIYKALTAVKRWQRRLRRPASKQFLSLASHIGPRSCRSESRLVAGAGRRSAHPHDFEPWDRRRARKRRALGR